MEHLLCNIGNSLGSYQKILQLYASLARFRECGHTIRIEQWFDANMCAVLGALLEGFCDVDITTSHLGIRDIFSRNGFAPRCGILPRPDTKNTVIPYTQIPAQNYSTDLVNYLSLLTRSDGFPMISEALERKIKENIAELFANANQHSHSSYIFSCGQYKPKTEVLHFTIVDRGIGFLQSVSKFNNFVQTDSEAIVWALKHGNSTKSRTGGLGLTLLQKFIKMNGGKMTIISGDCFYIVEPEEPPQTLQVPFPGSVISLQFNSKDPAIYCLQEEMSDSFPF